MMHLDNFEIVIGQSSGQPTRCVSEERDSETHVGCDENRHGSRCRLQGFVIRGGKAGSAADKAHLVVGDLFSVSPRGFRVCEIDEHTAFRRGTIREITTEGNLQVRAIHPQI